MMPSVPDPRPILLAQVEAAMRDAERRSQAIFGLQPKAPVVLRREPALSEKSAAAHYTVPAPDGSTPGIYWLPLADLGPRVTWLGAGLKSTAYHEAVPGHHFQLAIQQESATLPKYRKLGAFGLISAYGEGWALYAERLADENGWYADDPRGRLGYLNLQLFRARRLVVDTGIHAMHWTRQQAIDYGFTPTEVERYIVWPGQACSYMIGQLKIVELRERAQKALGERFSLKVFTTSCSVSATCRSTCSPAKSTRGSRSSNVADELGSPQVAMARNVIPASDNVRQRLTANLRNDVVNTMTCFHKQKHLPASGQISACAFGRIIKS